MSISVGNANKILLENVPIYYQDFAKVLGTAMKSALPEHGHQDIYIDLIQNT